MSSDLVTDPAVVALWKQVYCELGIKHKIPLLYKSKLIKSPLLVGLIKPILILPKNIPSAANLRFVFMHELTHLKRYDLWYKWFVQLTFCLYWFNPLIYAISRWINNLCELSCDEAVSMNLDQSGKVKYCKVLLDTLASGMALDQNIVFPTLHTHKNNIRERLNTILKTGKVSGKMTCLSSVLSMTLCMTTLFMGAYSSGENFDSEQPVVDKNFGQYSAIAEQEQLEDINRLSGTETSLGDFIKIAYPRSLEHMPESTLQFLYDRTMVWPEE